MTSAEVKENEVEENGKIVESSPPVQIKKHPLKREWTYWYLNDDRMMRWEDRLKSICTFGTVEDFWALYNNIKLPSQINVTCDYNVFKKEIEPMWEVPENLNGGRWLINIDKSRGSEIMDIIWLEILLAMIGEQFGEDMENICGLVANVRAKGSKISVWTRDRENDASNMRIGNIIKQKLLTAPTSERVQGPIFDVIKYEGHDACQHKTSSSVKSRLTISSVEGKE